MDFKNREIGDDDSLPNTMDDVPWYSFRMKELLYVVKFMSISSTIFFKTHATKCDCDVCSGKNM